MSFYSRVIFPRVCNWALDRPLVAAERSKLLDQVDGEILEIGFGTGLNLPHYPSRVRRIMAIDPNPGMHRRAAAAIGRTGIEVDKHLLRGEELPFDSGRFDCVVSTFTLCSVGDVDQALAEAYRLLKPGGRFLLLEHGLSPDANVSRWQRRLNGVQRVLADNCHLDRDMNQLVRRQPFNSVQLEAFYMPQIPKTHGYVFKGAAVK
jgi:ubiquinone/menaquinone biosynthesis C-methylase UbiE